MDAGFYRGTSTEQDIRFTDKERKLLKQMKFEDILDTKVDFAKINLNVVKPWITIKLNEILGMEDDVVVEYVFTQLEEKELNPKKMQINLTGFLNARRAREFMGELWAMFVEAQNSPEGIPVSLVEKKVQELKASNSKMEREQTYAKATEIDWKHRYQSLTGGRYGKIEPKYDAERAGEPAEEERRRRDPDDDRDERAERRMRYEEQRFKERKDLLREKQRRDDRRRERTPRSESPPTRRAFRESANEKPSSSGRSRDLRNEDEGKEKRKKNKKEKARKRGHSESGSEEERSKKAKKHKKEKKSRKHKDRD